MVFDPDDPGREWKVFAYKYLWTPDGNFTATRRYSGIISAWAGTPGQAWENEGITFAAAPGYPPPPYDEHARVRLNELDPSLADVTLYARPSAVYAQGALLMTLSAYAGQETPDRIVMIVSLDHGKTWQYVGTPLRLADLAALGPYTRLGGASLLMQGGKAYLAAVFGDAQTAGLGTHIFAFDDVSKGALKRDAAGKPQVVRVLPRFSAAPTAIGGGYAAYTDNCFGEMLTGEHSGLRRMFQIFKTGVKPSGK